MGQQRSTFPVRVAIACVGALVAATIGVGVTIANSSAPTAKTTATGGTSIVAPTATPGRGFIRPTVTPTPPFGGPGTGQTVLSGSIDGVDPTSGSFSLLLNDGTDEIILVSDATQYQGDAQSFFDLQPGMSARVSGVDNGDGTLSATLVDATFGS